MRALWTAATGMQAQQLTLDVVANNLANVQTAGFKRSRVDFQDLVYETLQAPGASSAQGQEIPTGFQVGHGTRAVATQRLFIKGDMQQTGNSLDMAIEGDGFFQVTLPSGDTGYTRAGTFKKNSQGQMVTSDGFTLQPQITIPAKCRERRNRCRRYRLNFRRGPNPAATGRQHRAGALHQSGRTAQPGSQRVSAHPGVGRCHRWHARTGRLGHVDPRFCRRVQRQRGRRDGRFDHQPARL